MYLPSSLTLTSYLKYIYCKLYIFMQVGCMYFLIFAFHSLVHYFYPNMTLATLFGDQLCVQSREKGRGREGRSDGRRSCRRIKNPNYYIIIIIHKSEPVFVDLSRIPRNDSQPAGPVRQPYLSYRPARLSRLSESIPRNRFLGSINVYKYGLCLFKFMNTGGVRGIVCVGLRIREQ